MIPFVVVALFFSGLLLGYILRDKDVFRGILESGINWVIYLLLFLLGISVGTRKEIIDNFSKIGFDAVLITLGAMVGSIFLAFILYKWLFEEKGS